MKKIIDKNIIKNILISAGVNLLVAILAIFVFGVSYAVDDDPSMSYIAYGIYADPSARVVFSNVIFGEIIKLFFVLKPTINWQVAFYFAGLCAGGFISLYEILKSKEFGHIMMWVIFVSCFFHTSFCEVTFTIVAAYICVQGFLAFFLAIKNNDKVVAMLSGGVIFYASLIRFLSVMAISMSVFVAWILIVIFEFDYCRKKDTSERLKKITSRYAIPFVILFAVVGLGFAIDRIAYSNPEWSSYDEYNNLRSDILDNASIIVDDDFEKQAELGITPAMAASLKAWKFNDPEVYTTELFGNILRESLESRGEYSPHPFRDMWISIKNLIISNFVLQIEILLLFSFGIETCLKNKRLVLKNAFLLMTGIPVLAQIFIYCYMGRYVDAVAKTFPPRVIDMALMGFAACLILVEVCCENDEETVYSKTQNRKLIFGLLVGTLLLSVVLQTREGYRIKGFSLKSESMIEDSYSYLNDGHIYVMDWKAYQIFMMEYRCWQNPPQGYLNNITLLGGCEIKYPLLVEKEKRMGISNPYKALYENENVFLVSTEYPEIELNYLRDVYDDSIECELVANYDTLDVYNFVCN